MDDANDISDCGMGEVIVHKLDGVRTKECFCDGISYMEAVVVVDCWTNVEAFAATEVPRFSCGGFLWIITRHPMGPMGVALKLKGPL